VGVEEGDDPSAGVLGRGLVVADAHHAHGPGHRVAVVVEEGVPGARVQLDVVRHADGGEDLFQPVGGAPGEAVAGAVAAHDRAGAGQHRLGVGVLAGGAVVDAGGLEAVAGGEQQREPAAMQNPMTPIIPVQSSRWVSQARTASTSSKVRPRPVAASRIIERRQPSLRPRAKNRSGAAAR
jgi:hypothetical protein